MELLEKEIIDTKIIIYFWGLLFKFQWNNILHKKVIENYINIIADIKLMSLWEWTLNEGQIIQMIIKNTGDGKFRFFENDDKKKCTKGYL